MPAPVSPCMLAHAGVCSSSRRQALVRKLPRYRLESAEARTIRRAEETLGMPTASVPAPARRGSKDGVGASSGGTGDAARPRRAGSVRFKGAPALSFRGATRVVTKTSRLLRKVRRKTGKA